RSGPLEGQSIGVSRRTQRGDPSAERPACDLRHTGGGSGKIASADETTSQTLSQMDADWKIAASRRECRKSKWPRDLRNRRDRPWDVVWSRENEPGLRRKSRGV